MENSRKWNPTVLILGSGGRKGYLMLGLLLLLKHTKILDNIKVIIGVSVGAVIGLLYNIGCSITEILEISLSVNPSQLFDTMDVKNVTTSFGLFSHDLFRDHINKKMIKYFGFVPTLQQLYYMTGIKFIAGVVNVTDDKEEYLSYETEPDLLSTEAVLMSMNIPIVFHTYKYKHKLYVDGGIANTLPIQLYDDGNNDILGIKLTESTKSNPSESIISYITRVFHIIISKRTKNLLDQRSNRCEVIYLSDEIKGSAFDPVGLKLSFENKSQMIIEGYLNGLKFLEYVSSKYDYNYRKDNIEILDLSYFLNELQ
jgi:predicted acylesterase/phospholipase RssA